MRGLALAALLLAGVPAYAQDRPAGAEAVDFAYQQLGQAVNGMVQRLVTENNKLRAETAAGEAQKATLIEWLKAAQTKK